jgi:hypothetical protein
VHVMAWVRGTRLDLTLDERVSSSHDLSAEEASHGFPVILYEGTGDGSLQVRDIYAKVLRAHRSSGAVETATPSLPEGWMGLFTGQDISYTWQPLSQTRGWRVEGGNLVARGEGNGTGFDGLVTFQEFRGDWDLHIEVKGHGTLAVHPRLHGNWMNPRGITIAGDDWHVLVTRVRGQQVSILLDDEEVDTMALLGTQGVVGLAFDTSQPTHLEIRIIRTIEVR